jgi:glyoxylase-like metal-dependent hydrolase (beta-lactamase superfamily II)
LGDQHSWIVDPAAHRPDTQHDLTELLRPFQPTGIFLTHHHHDHIGAALLLSETFQIPIYAHPKTAELLSIPHHPILDNDTIHIHHEMWTAIHTPGHAPGHVCLLSSYDQSLIAGDMVAGEGTILINPKEGSIREYLNSLRHLESLAPNRLLPAHGNILADAVSTLQEYQQHRLNRIQQIQALLTSTSQSSRDIAAKIYTDLPQHFLGMAAVQVECGLIYLEEDTLVTSIRENGQTLWRHSNTTNGSS